MIPAAKRGSRMLEHAGYDVVLRNSHIDAESFDHEDHFDLIVLTLHRKKLDDAAAYSERLRKQKVNLPILLLTDHGVFVPRGTLSPSIETGQPEAMIQEIACMIAGSTHVRELDI